MKREPRVWSTCTVCVGPIYAQQGAITGEYTHGNDDRGVWLHHHATDWVTNPHPATPSESDAEVLVARIASYWRRVRGGG